MDAGLRHFTLGELETFAREWERLFDSGHAAAMAAFYAEDAQLVGTGWRR